VELQSNGDVDSDNHAKNYIHLFIFIHCAYGSVLWPE